MYTVSLLPHLTATSASLASLLIASIWQGVLLTSAAALGLRVLPGLSAAARSALWTVVLLLVILLPWLPLAAASSPGAAPVSLWHAGETFSLGIVALWAVASLWQLSQLAGNAVRLHGLVRRAVPVATSAALSRLLADGSRHVVLCSSVEVDRPGVAGFLRPRILLPPGLLTQLTEAELAQVVLHETEHLRRYDDWLNLLQQVSLALFPLNPALFWLNRRLSLERELACDDGVLRSTGARKAYAACLARVAEGALVRGGLSLALGLLGTWFGREARRPELSQRVERILGSPVPVLGRTPMRLATGVVCAVLLGCASLLAHTPQLVSFTPATPALGANFTPQPLKMTESPTAVRVSSTGNDRAMLVRAVMPMPPASTPLSGTGRPWRRYHAYASSSRRTVRQAWGSRGTVRTQWQFTATAQKVSEQQLQENAETLPVVASEELNSGAPRLTPVLFHNAQGWYTAVPFRGGWLVVQL